MILFWGQRQMSHGAFEKMAKMSVTMCSVLLTQGSVEHSWHSHKFNGPGLRYEVAICMLTGCTVWIMGPFPCGDWPDIEIFRFALNYNCFLRWVLILSRKLHRGVELIIHSFARMAGRQHSKKHSQNTVFT